MTATAKDVLALYIENQMELSEIFESEDTQYEAVQSALVEFWLVNETLIENGFSDAPTGIVRTQHIQAAKKVLSELAEVVTTRTLKNAINEIYNNLDTMQGKALKDAIKSFDTLSFDVAQ